METPRHNPTLCPACQHQLEAPADQCPRCGERFQDPGETARLAADRQSFMDTSGAVLLLVGLAMLCGCWIYDKNQGMIGGGFLAVVGAVLLRRK